MQVTGRAESVSTRLQPMREGNQRAYREVLGRRDCQPPFVLETGHIRRVALLKLGVRVGRHDSRFGEGGLVLSALLSTALFVLKTRGGRHDASVVLRDSG